MQARARCQQTRADKSNNVQITPLIHKRRTHVREKKLGELKIKTRNSRGVKNSQKLASAHSTRSDAYISHMLSAKMDEIEQDAEQILTVLEDEKQALWSILRSSLSHKLDYWLTLSYPSHAKIVSERMDTLQNL
ncbi:MAG: hypothetical protein GY928_22285, partial [Colwellia sp.]|nr:hypothetical protein [Colwellia sp.]